MTTRERQPAGTATDAAAPHHHSPAGSGPRGRSTGTAPSSRWRLPGLLGVAAVACVSCYAGPILAVLGGLGVASSLFIGTAGLLVAGGAALAFLAVRRRDTACDTVASGAATGPEPVSTPHLEARS